MSETELVIGGVAGVGFEVAKKSYHQGRRVMVTGSEDITLPYKDIEVRQFKFRASRLVSDIGQFVTRNIREPIDSLVYTAHYPLEAKFLDQDDIDDELMLAIGFRGLHYFTKRIAQRHGGRVEEVVAVMTAPHGQRRPPSAMRYGIDRSTKGWLKGAVKEGVVGKALVVDLADGVDSYYPSGIAGAIMAARQEGYEGLEYLSIGQPVNN